MLRKYISEVIDQGIEVVVEVNSISASAEAWEIGKFGSQENFHSREIPHFVEEGVGIIFGENNGTFRPRPDCNLEKSAHRPTHCRHPSCIRRDLRPRLRLLVISKPITIGSGIGVATVGHDLGNYDLSGGRQGKESEKGDGILHLNV